jgi:hypothetical protein
VNTTLVTSLTVRQKDPMNIVHRNDVPLTIDQQRRHTVLQFTTTDMAVDIRLTQAEVISLIESLGGQVK